ncbi:MAG: CBS domain-containing protein [Polyangiaceae bacterium]|nr:CBS domain-containing protein [Polyangiaceae bacterium]
MTRAPRTLEADATLAQAHEIMREEGFRHLPVLERGKLIGLLSQRDLHLIETLRDVDPEKVRVREAMVSHPYFVPPDARLAEVVAEMADHKFGAAVVMENGKVVGMFTTVDALRAFVDHLKEQPPQAEPPPVEPVVEEERPAPERPRKPGSRGRARARQSSN